MAKKRKRKSNCSWTVPDINLGCHDYVLPKWFHKSGLTIWVYGNPKYFCWGLQERMVIGTICPFGEAAYSLN